jgi:hypothetical protein
MSEAHANVIHMSNRLFAIGLYRKYSGPFLLFASGLCGGMTAIFLLLLFASGLCGGMTATFLLLLFTSGLYG